MRLLQNLIEDCKNGKLGAEEAIRLAFESGRESETSIKSAFGLVDKNDTSQIDELVKINEKLVGQNAKIDLENKKLKSIIKMMGEVL